MLNTESDHHYIKCVAIGDGAVGKTCLFHTYTTNKFPWDYEPTVFDNYAVTVNVGKQSITLGLFDTAGQEDWDRLRIMSYTSTDIFIICFSVMEPASFWNVEEKWIPEIRAWSPGTPYLLIGTQIDLRDNAMSLQKMSHKKQKPISKDEGERMAKKWRAYAYIECSSLLNLNVKHGKIFLKAFSAMQPIYDHYKKI